MYGSHSVGGRWKFPARYTTHTYKYIYILTDSGNVHHISVGLAWACPNIPTGSVTQSRMKELQYENNIGAAKLYTGDMFYRNGVSLITCGHINMYKHALYIFMLVNTIQQTFAKLH